jgi:hypothetical protein
MDLVKPAYRKLVRGPVSRDIGITLLGEVTDIGEAPARLGALKRAGSYFIWK